MERKTRFGLVLSADEREALARLAEREGGLSRAATIRRLLRRAAHEHGLWPATPVGSLTQRQSGTKSLQEARR